MYSGTEFVKNGDESKAGKGALDTQLRYLKHACQLLSQRVAAEEEEEDGDGRDTR